MERVELIGSGCRYRERDRIERPRAAALGLYIRVRQPGRVAIEDGTYRLYLIHI